MDEWLTAEEASRYLGIGASNLYTLAQNNRIPGHKLGKMWRFNKLELDLWLRANKPIEEFFSASSFSIEDNAYLRDPQKEGYSASINYFEKGGRRAILQIPVGCGKSGLISILPFGIANGRVLVIAPNLTILRELEKTLDNTNKRGCFWRKCEVLSPETMSAGPYIATLNGETSNIHDCDNSHIVLTNIQQL